MLEITWYTREYIKLESFEENHEKIGRKTKEIVLKESEGVGKPQNHFEETKKFNWPAIFLIQLEIS